MRPKTSNDGAFSNLHNGSLEVLVGGDVLMLINDPSFIEKWEELCQVCPWTTTFQTPSFVATWYRIYGETFLPVLIKVEDEGKLTALFTLSRDSNGVIRGAGANMAEYVSWLAADPNSDTFIRSALHEIDRVFPGNLIILKYIPSDVPLNFLEKDSEWKGRWVLTKYTQPLMIINDDHLSKELKKKNRREKINRLKKLGDLTFERITDHEQFVAVFDELAHQFDFRMGGMYNKLVFKSDPLRKKFLISLFEQGLLHATTLKVDDKIIASNVGVMGEDVIYLQGLNTHCATFAKYSPGIIHFLLLGKFLAAEGLKVFDLTPGGDNYKEMLATDHKVAYHLSIGNKYHARTNRIRSSLKNYINKIAPVCKIKQTISKTAADIRLYKDRLSNMFFNPGFDSGKVNSLTKCPNFWIVKGSGPVSSCGLIQVHKDCVKDLLDFDSCEKGQCRQEFLLNAMHRFQDGEHCFTWAKGGLLLACAWLSEKTTSTGESADICVETHPTLSLTKLYCHSKARAELPKFLQSVFSEIAVDKSAPTIYVAADHADYDALNQAGFQLASK